MRSKNAARNMIANVVLQVIVFLTGIVFPRFIMEVYGSTINGAIVSINQFLVYLGLAEAGVGTASIVALYSPLAADDKEQINGILSATRLYFNRSGILFTGLVGLFAVVYPFFISGQLSASFVRMMIVILASSTLVDYVLLGKYKVLLVAHQKGYIIAYVQAAGTVINVVTSLLLIYMGCGILTVKAVATGIYVLRFFVIRAHVRRNYPEVRYREKPLMDGLNQRNAALVHQIVGAIVNNTDVVLLTICLGARSLVEVSVYGVYNMIVYALNLMLTSFSDGLTAGFGEVFSKGETEILRESHRQYEYVFFLILFIITVCMGVLLLPFVSIYTMNTRDADYYRPLAALLFTAVVFLQNIRIPGLTLVCAAGHFRETQKQAIMEAFVNCSVSLCLVWKLGIDGVLIGTVCSFAFRSIEVILYSRKHLLKTRDPLTWKRLTINSLIVVLMIRAGIQLVPRRMESFLIWIVYAVITGVVSLMVFVTANYFLEPSTFRALWRRLRQILSAGSPEDDLDYEEENNV